VTSRKYGSCQQQTADHILERENSVMPTSVVHVYCLPEIIHQGVWERGGSSSHSIIWPPQFEQEIVCTMKFLTTLSRDLGALSSG